MIEKKSSSNDKNISEIVTRSRNTQSKETSVMTESEQATTSKRKHVTNDAPKKSTKKKTDRVSVSVEQEEIPPFQDQTNLNRKQTNNNIQNDSTSDESDAEVKMQKLAPIDQFIKFIRKEIGYQWIYECLICHKVYLVNKYSI